MADHGKAREKGSRSNDPQWDNKEALYRYVQHFPEMQDAIKFRQAQNTVKSNTTESTASTVRDVEGQTLVGFGPYKHMSRFDLFHSTQFEHRNYVNSILTTPVTHPGGQLDKLKSYIKAQRRNQENDKCLIQACIDAKQQLTETAGHSTSQEKEVYLPKAGQETLPKLQQEWLSKCLYRFNPTAGMLFLAKQGTVANT
mgnify:CR=1 FL=1